MIKLIIKITNFISKKRSIKMLAVILIIGIFFFHTAYADNTSSTLLGDTQNFLDKGVNLLSRIWIFLAMIAGKFMTNDVVYGAFMNLDKYLRAIRNVMKNFANFGLAVMILYSIIKYVINQKGGGDNPKKIIVNALLAGVLIQMSWFMVGALVDLSTVATSAIAAFPAKFIGSNVMITNVETELHAIYAKPVYTAKIVNGNIQREPPTTKADGTASCGADGTDGLDAIMPKYDSVSGPLIFIGMAFFKTQNYMNQGALSDDISGGGKLIINFALKFIILLSYVLCLVGLVIANLIRVLFLRVLITASPVIILIGVFGGNKGTGGEGVTKYFNIQTFMNLIFKPVFLIGFLGLTLIFVSSMQQIMGGGKGIKDMQGVTITNGTGSSKIAMNGIADFQINGNVFADIADDTKNVFVDLMLIVMTMLLLWKMLVRSMEFGGGPVAEVMGKLTPLVESFAGNLPIAKIGGTDMGIANAWGAAGAVAKKTLKGFKIETSGKFAENEQAFKRNVYSKFLGIQTDWSDIESDKLRDTIRTGGDFRGELKKLGKETSGGVSLSNGTQMGLIEEWFKKNRNNDILMNTLGTPARSEDDTFDKYMAKYPDAVDKLHNLLGGSNEEKNHKTPASYEELKKNIYQYTPPKE